MGVNEGKQKAYEGGKANPKILYFDRIEKATGLKSDDLINKDIPVDQITFNGEKVKKVKKVNNQSEEMNSEDIRSLSRAVEFLAKAEMNNTENMKRLINLIELQALGKIQDLPKEDSGLRNLKATKEEKPANK
jgi:hypothetical protein